MLEVKVCVGTGCFYKGSFNIMEYLEDEPNLKGKIELTCCKCFNKACKPDNSPVVMVGDELILKATLDKVLLKIGERIT